MAVAEPLPIVRLRHWGRWVGAAVIVAALVLLFIALSRAQIKWSSVPDFVVYRVMVVGLVNTVLLALVAQAAAIVIGSASRCCDAARTPSRGGSPRPTSGCSAVFRCCCRSSSGTTSRWSSR